MSNTLKTPITNYTMFISRFTHPFYGAAFSLSRESRLLFEDPPEPPPDVPPKVEDPPKDPPKDPPAPPAKPAQGDDKVPDNWEDVYKSKRWTELRARTREAEEKLSKYEKDQKKEAERKAIEAGEHQKVIDELKPQAERADALEKLMEDTVTKAMESMPEENRSLVPEALTVEQKLKYIEDNRERLYGKDAPPTVGKPTNPASTTAAGGRIYTTQEIADMPPDEYAELSADIKKASAEGRIND